MREWSRTLRPAVSAALALAAVAACVPPTTTPTGPAPRSRLTTGPSPSPAEASPRTGTAASASPEGANAASASPGVPASMLPGPTSPAPTALASPAPLASADPRRSLIASKLLTLARVSFNQNRGQLAAAKAFEGTGAALLGNNGAGIISNNGGAIIANNGSGLVSNNGGGLITDNGAGIVANNGSGYRLTQAAALDVKIETTAQAGETLVARRLWPDDVVLYRFDRPGATDEKVRRIVHVKNDEPFYEETRELLERWPDGTERKARTTTVERIAGGRFVYRLLQLGEGDDDGATTRIRLEPGSVVRDEATGGITAIENDFDLVANTATFKYDYVSLGLIEAGTLANVTRQLGGGIQIAFWDPLAIHDGDSTVTDAAGKTVYTKKQRTVSGEVHRDFDLGDGITLAVTRVDADHYEGRLAEIGRETAKVALEARTDGSAVFTVTFDDAPTTPLVVGFGLRDQPLGTRPTSPPQYVVFTSMGTAQAADVSGSRSATRFNQPMALVRSRLTDAKFYLADTASHRVRLVKKPFETAQYAGDGTAGHRDGEGDEAQFNEPFGIAVGPDDTVYVTEHAGHRVRVITPSGVVSTLAGDGVAGRVDGVGEAARFDHPTGAALDDQGRLYVADALNHVIRRIETSGPDKGKVVTVAGDGTAGFADGTGTAARFSLPMGLTIGPDGAVYVADRDNYRIRKLTPEGVVTTVAGTSDRSRRYFDGPALEAGFNGPHFVAFGYDGLLYFTTAADIYYLTAGGEVRSYAGVGAPGWGDGVAKFSAFTDCNGLAFANNGSMHVMDGNRLRAIVPPSAIGR